MLEKNVKEIDENALEIAKRSFVERSNSFADVWNWDGSSSLQIEKSKIAFDESLERLSKFLDVKQIQVIYVQTKLSKILPNRVMLSNLFFA